MPTLRLMISTSAMSLGYCFQNKIILKKMKCKYQPTDHILFFKVTRNTHIIYYGLTKLWLPNSNWGHNVCGADSIGVCIVLLDSWLHSMYWTNKWILAKHAYIIWMEERCEQISLTLTLFSRSQGPLEYSRFEKENLVCTISLEPLDGYRPSIMVYWLHLVIYS